MIVKAPDRAHVEVLDRDGQVLEAIDLVPGEARELATKSLQNGETLRFHGRGMLISGELSTPPVDEVVQRTLDEYVCSSCGSQSLNVTSLTPDRRWAVHCGGCNGEYMPDGITTLVLACPPRVTRRPLGIAQERTTP